MGTFSASRDVGRSRPAGNGRRVDDDGAGIFGIVPRETICLPAGPQSSRFVRTGAALYFSGQASNTKSRSQPAGTFLGLLDEPGNFRRGGFDDDSLWPQGVFTDPADCFDGGRLSRSMVVLRAASIRRRVLGTSRRMGLRRRSVARQVVLQAAPRAAMVFGNYW